MNETYNSLDYFFYQETGSTEIRLDPYAAGRLKWLAEAMEEAEVRRAEKVGNLTAPAWSRMARAVADTAVPADELRLARQLIDAAGGPPDWSRYPDTTAEELAALVAAKVAGRPPARRAGQRTARTATGGATTTA